MHPASCVLGAGCVLCVQREANGHNYYQVEFTAANSRYTRHQLAVVAVSNGEACHAMPCHAMMVMVACGACVSCWPA
jgi:hypothetical protein